MLTIVPAVSHFADFRSSFAPLGNLCIFCMLSSILFSKEKTTERLFFIVGKHGKSARYHRRYSTVHLIKFVNTFCHFLKIIAITHFH